VKHDGQWQSISLRIPDAKPIFALRLDVCSAPGEARIEDLQLKDVTGKVVKSWP